MQLRKSPFDVTKIDESRIDDFKECIWYNSEICNGCFSRVRLVGPKVSKTLEEPTEKMLEDNGPLQRMESNEWYERTELGSQEYSSFDTNKRFGTCYCKNCGSDCSSFDEIPTKQALTDMAERIAEYANEHTELDVDRDHLVDEAAELKAIPQTDGWDTEILAVAFSRALR
ncbi:hypothetical protein [Natrinema sp. H-ect4]|uniref:hypothetical protein n=1 Tax=Natrinema sp. H-ect4 TaxID=3242699 RepID=UPI0035A96DBA